MPKTWEVEAAKMLESVQRRMETNIKPFQPHDFKKYPELTNAQIALHGAMSPHAQHTGDFMGRCVKVMDGDTIAVQWAERNFPTKVRFINIAAAEIGEGGETSKEFMISRVLGKEVEVKINLKSKTGKYGRLLGKVFQGGMDVGYESALYNHAEVTE